MIQTRWTTELDLIKVRWDLHLSTQPKGLPDGHNAPFVRRSGNDLKNVELLGTTSLASWLWVNKGGIGSGKTRSAYHLLIDKLKQDTGFTAIVAAPTLEKCYEGEREFRYLMDAAIPGHQFTTEVYRAPLAKNLDEPPVLKPDGSSEQPLNCKEPKEYELLQQSAGEPMLICYRDKDHKCAHASNCRSYNQNINATVLFVTHKMLQHLIKDRTRSKHPTRPAPSMLIIDEDCIGALVRDADIDVKDMLNLLGSLDEGARVKWAFRKSTVPEDQQKRVLHYIETGEMAALDGPAEHERIYRIRQADYAKALMDATERTARDLRNWVTRYEVAPSLVAGPNLPEDEKLVHVLPLEGRPDRDQLELLLKLLRDQLARPKGQPVAAAPVDDRKALTKWKKERTARLKHLRQINAKEQPKLKAASVIANIISAIELGQFQDQRLFTHHPGTEIGANFKDDMVLITKAFALPRELYQVPTLLLSATAETEVLRRFWTFTEETEPSTPPRDLCPEHRILISGQTGSKSSLLASAGVLTETGKKFVRLAALLAVKHAHQANGGSALLVTGQLKVIEAMAPHIEELLPEGVKVDYLNFGSTAGRNHAKAIPAQFIIGRMEPRPSALRLTIEALTGISLPHSVHWQRTEGQSTAKDGTVFQTSDPYYTLPGGDGTSLVERLMTYEVQRIAKAEIVQADRLRGIWRDLDDPDTWATTYYANSMDMSDHWGQPDEVMTLDDGLCPVTELAARYGIFPEYQDGKLAHGYGHLFAHLMPSFGKTARNVSQNMSNRKKRLGELIRDVDRVHTFARPNLFRLKLPNGTTVAIVMDAYGLQDAQRNVDALIEAEHLAKGTTVSERYGERSDKGVPKATKLTGAAKVQPVKQTVNRG